MLIGAVTPLAAERAARLADGFIAAFRDWEGLTDHIRWYRDAGGNGAVIVRAGPLPSEDDPSGLAHPWSPESMPDSLQRARSLGVDEVIWDLNIVFMPRRGASKRISLIGEETRSLTCRFPVMSVVLEITAAVSLTKHIGDDHEIRTLDATSSSGRALPLRWSCET